MAFVRVRGPLRALAGGISEHALEGDTVIGLLRELERERPALCGWIVDERGLVRRHINVFVNGERSGQDAIVPADARVEIIPAITGG